MKSFQPLMTIIALLLLFNAGCGGTDSVGEVVDATDLTPPEQDLAGTYIMSSFIVCYYDSVGNGIGCTSNSSYTYWFAQLQLGSGDLYQSWNLNGEVYEYYGSYTPSYITSTVGDLNVILDGNPQTWAFSCPGNNQLETYFSGNVPGYLMSFIEQDYWIKYSDSPTAFQ